MRNVARTLLIYQWFLRFKNIFFEAATTTEFCFNIYFFTFSEWSINAFVNVNIKEIASHVSHHPIVHVKETKFTLYSVLFCSLGLRCSVFYFYTTRKGSHLFNCPCTHRQNEFICESRSEYNWQRRCWWGPTL